MDVLQVGEHISGAMAADSIFVKWPELQKASRHLATSTGSGSNDHQPESLIFFVDQRWGTIFIMG
jgi:hypothetical protein